ALARRVHQDAAVHAGQAGPLLQIAGAEVLALAEQLQQARADRIVADDIPADRHLPTPPRQQDRRVRRLTAEVLFFLADMHAAVGSRPVGNSQDIIEPDCAIAQDIERRGHNALLAGAGGCGHRPRSCSSMVSLTTSVETGIIPPMIHQKRLTLSLLAVALSPLLAA